MKGEDLQMAVRIWFNYLSLARRSDRPDVQKALKKSAAVYEQWGDFENQPFEEWWETHSYMFEHKIISVRPPSEGEENDSIPCPSKNDLLLFIPLWRSTRSLLQDVRVHITEQKRLAEKAKRRSPMQELAEGKSPRIGELIDKMCVGIVAFDRPRPTGRPLLIKVQNHYRAHGWKLPRALELKPGRDLATVLRTLDRYVKGADQVMLNVAQGRFPGRITKDKHVA